MYTSTVIPSGVPYNGTTITYNNAIVVPSGGIANSTTVNAGGKLHVHSGGTANPIIENGGYVVLENGANVVFAPNSFSGVYLYNSRWLATVHSGTTANNTTVTYSGWLIVYSGGIANSTTVNDGGKLHVHSGGTANNTTVTYSGWLIVYSGGMANSTTVNDSGWFIVHSGGTANSTTVGSGGMLTVSYGGTANNTTVSYGGMLAVSYGGTANNTTVSYGGMLTIYNDGTANSATVNSGGCLQVTWRGIMNNTMVNSGGTIYISSGGTANSTTVSSGGSLTVFNGGTANSTTVGSGGMLAVSYGGTANAIVENGGYVYADDDDTEAIFASNTFSGLVLTNASATVHSGTTANSVTINSKGSMFVYDGGKITGELTIESGADVSMYTGAILDFDLEQTNARWGKAIVNDLSLLQGNPSYTITTSDDVSDGIYFLAEGAQNFNGTISVTTTSGNVLGTLRAGEYFWLSGTRYFLNLSDDVLYLVVGEIGYYNGFDYLDGRVIERGMTINDWNAIIAGGVINSGGTVYVYEYYTASSFYVNPGGVLSVESGGEANDIIENGGWVEVHDDNGYNGMWGRPTWAGFASHSFSGLVLNERQSATVHSGTTAISPTVNSGGSLCVFGDGIASNVTENGGWVDAGGIVSFASNTISSMDLSSASATIHSGTTVFSPTVNGGGFLAVYSGGTATDILENGGCVMLQNGASVNFLSNTLSGQTLSRATIHSGTTALETTINEQITYVYDGGIASHTVVNNGGYFYVYSGGTALDIIENGGQVIISSGATANILPNTISGKVFQGQATIHSGTTAIETVVNGNITQVFSGGIANSTTVNNGGWFYVNSGGTAFDIVENGGYVGVSNGASASFRSNTFSNLSVFRTTVHSRTTANYITVQRDGWLHVFGGEANNTDIYGGTLVVQDGGIANYTEVREGDDYWMMGGYQGNLNVSYGGVANETTVGCNCYLTVLDGGLANNVTLEYNGYLYVHSGGIVTGRINTDESYAGLYFYDGSILDFDLTQTSVDQNALVDNFSFISWVNGTPCYTLTLSENEGYGKYNLAENVFSFNNTITVQNKQGESLGRISIDDPFITKGTVYVLNLDNQILSLNVVENAFPTVSNIKASVTKPTNQPIVVTADFADDFELASSWYKVGENGSWTNYTDGVWVSENTTVFFKAIDTTGNESEVVSYNVTNIDKVAPVIQSISADITTITNQDVTISTSFTDNVEAASTWYRLGLNGAWNPYTDTVTVAENNTVYFKAIDTAGNESEISSYSVTNIDKVSPNKPTASANTTSPTNVNVTVTATFSSDSVRKEYSLDNWNWQDYTQAIEFVQNGIVYFRGWDEAGNVSDVTVFNVTNIDKVAPNKPTTSADVTEMTNGNVKVTASFSEDSTKKEYSLDGVNWKTYSGPITFTENGVAYFRGTDAAGNLSQVATYSVTNIDKTPPTKPVATASKTEPTNQDVTVTAEFAEDAVIRESSLDGENWTAYFGAVRFSENGSVYFRATDAVGNVSEVTRYDVTNIDKVAPAKPTASADNTSVTNQDVTVTAVFSNDTAIKEYSTDGLVWSEFDGMVTVEENVKLYFRGRDAAGNISEVASYEVTNIDKIAPDQPSVSANTTTPTNQNVTVTATFSNDSVVREYSLNGTAWKTYSSPISFSQNGSVSFRGKDAAGNISEVASYIVDYIDKVAPTAPSAIADITAITNQDVTVTATFSSDSEVREYSLNGGVWRAYTTAIVFSQNGSVSFRGTDAAGNLSEVTTYTVSNIDKVAPDKPIATADVTAPTNSNVHVSAIFNAKSTVKEYSLDGTTWETYTGSVEFEENGTAYFRSWDEAGNVSETTRFNVTNIDKVAPDKPTASADITKITNRDVSVSAVFSNDSVVREYSVDGETWKTYSSAIVFAENGTVYFRGWDEAGNPSEVTCFDVTNIDKIAPEAPMISADVTDPTNTDVLVSAVFSDDSVAKEYSLDGTNWKTYNQSVKFTENGIVYFRGTDAAGNKSDIVSYTVSNIDKVAPNKPTASANITTPTNADVTVTAVFSDDSVVKEYSLDGTSWTAYTESIKFEQNGTVYFRGIDAAGNISDETSFAVTNIDKTPPAKPVVSADITAPTNQDVTLTADYGEDAAIKLYSIDGTTWFEYTGTVKLAKNGTVMFRSFDVAGNESETGIYTVENIDKIAPEAPVISADITNPTNTDVFVSAVFSDDSVIKEYSLDGESWTVYTAAVKFTENGTVYFRGWDEAGNDSEITSYTVTNIDKAAPIIELTGDNTTPLQASTLTAATETGLDLFYSMDNVTWTKYEGQIDITANATYYFKVTDAANNTGTASITFGNIDTTAPEKPGVSADITTITNQDVTVTAAFSDDSVVKEYSLDGETWTAYTTGIKFTENGTVSFRGTDAAGNVSEIATYSVSNIDKISPEKPIATANTTDPTNQDVTVTAEFSADSVVKQYSVNAGQTWLTYTDGIVFEQNGTAYFRSMDEAENVSEITSYAVTNIDKTAPEKPVASIDVTEITNGDVNVSAVFSDDSVIKEYSLDGQTWQTYAEVVTFAENGTIYFRGTDAAGNPSGVTSYSVTNIDKTPPEAPVATANVTAPTRGKVAVTATFSSDSVAKEYSQDGENWAPYAGAVYFVENGTAFFRSKDAAGNMSEITVYEVDNIDTVAPEKPVATADITTPTNGVVTVTAAFPEDVATKEYSLDNWTWMPYSEGIRMTENGAVFFRGTDVAGNMSAVERYLVSNIDKVAPEKPTASANITSVTNDDVLVSAVFSEDTAVMQYSLDGQIWQTYSEAVKLTGNGIVSFRGIDAAGNASAITTYEVTNIDKSAPVAPTASANTTEPTNQMVTVSAIFSKDVIVSEYSLDGQDWSTYTEGIKFTENGTVYFRGWDEAGNVSEVATFNVSNIDKIAPDAPIASADITNPTNTDVLVSAVFSEDTVKKEYSFDGTNWRTYSGAISFAVNGTVFFRGTDAAGNVSESASYEVTNIDKVAPDAPIATADITDPTNTNVRMSAIFNAKSVTKEYSLDGTTWETYTGSVEFAANGTICFRSLDAAGNVSEVTSYEVTNIDKIAPEKPVAGANITKSTNGDVLVTATFSEDSVTKEYSLDGTTWKTYSEAISFSANGTVFFRGTDEAGNVSEIASYTVGNIDKVAPVKPTASADITSPTNTDVFVSAQFSYDSVTKEYSSDGENWLAYSDAVKVTDNGTVFFRGTDEAGNISDVAQYTVANIDKIAPEKPVATANITAPTRGKVSMTATFSEDSVVKEYSLDGENWGTYVGAITFAENGTAYFRGWDNAGNKSEITVFEVGNIDTVAPEKPTASADITGPTNQDVTVTAVFSDDTAVREYSFDNWTWMEYADGITMSGNGIVYFRGKDTAGNISDVERFEVTNIDRIAPEKPEAIADIATPTNTDVVVTATFSEDSVTREFRIGDGEWTAYTDGVTLTENGVVYFRGTDEAGNVSETASYTVSNIDKIAPVIVLTGDTTTPLQAGTISASTEAELDLFFSTDGETWTKYTGEIAVTANGTYSFKTTDAAGNTGTADITFTNIDTTAPEKPVAVANITAPTNTDVTVTATFSEDSLVKEYSVNGGDWKPYSAAILFTENGSVAFRGTDAAGNISEVTTCTVSNNDKIAPKKPTASADVTAPTNTAVLVSAVFSDDSIVKEYTLDGQNWLAYMDAVRFEENGSVSFRGIDEAGNVSEVTDFLINNIDKVAPVAPTASADVTIPTNQDVTVTAAFSEDSVVREYSLDGENWIAYTEPVKFAENGSVFFRGTDKAGNISDVTDFLVSNIDKVIPTAPTASADITNPTNKDVSVSAEFSDDSVVKEYSLDGQTWIVYTGAVKFADNGSVFFRGTDEAGNISEVTGLVVNNIDKIIPVKPTASADVTVPTNTDVLVSAQFSDDSVVKEYTLDGQNWLAYTDAVKFEENGTVSFRGIDEAGNISEIETVDVSNIDKVAPTKPMASADVTAATNGDVLVSAVFSNDSVVKEYSLDGETWATYTDAVKFTANGTVFFRGTDEAGNISEVTDFLVNNIDKVAPVIASTSISQGTDDYVFAATVTASDNRTAAANLGYSIRYAVSAETLPEIEPISGLSFTLDPSDAGKTMYYQVGAADAAGNITWTEAKAFTVSDHTAPDLNGSPQAEFRNRAVSVTWDAATDNIAVAGYRLTLNGEVHDLREPGYVLEGVEAGSYTYQVTAYDAAGNETASELQSLTVEPRADLYLRSVRILKDNKPVTTISTQDKVTLSIQIGNMGDVRAPASAAHIYCGEVRLAEIAVTSIAPDGTADCVYTIEAGRMSTGIQDIRVVVNATSSLAEYAESNNEKSLTLNVENQFLSDLVIGSVQLDRAIYSAEDNAVLTFTVRNNGYVEAAASKAYIYDGETPLGSVDVAVVEAGTGSESLSYTIEAGKLAPGSHTIRVVADAEKAVPETNEDNNGAQVQLVVGQCDLGISKLAISQDVCDTGDAVTLNFTVRNSGTDKAAASVAGIYDGNKLLGTVEIGELSTGLSVSKQFVIASGMLEAGLHTLRVVADSVSSVAESDEANNVRSVSLQVNLKDDVAPAFTDVSIQQGAEDYGFAVTATATDNITPADKLVYGLRYAETAEGLESIGTLNRTEFSLTPEYAGKTMYYQVSATDLAGNTAWSEVRTFTVADNTSPDILNLSVSTTDTTLRLLWDAADNVGVTSYKIYLDDELVSTQEATSYTQEGVSLGRHTYRIDAYDAAGNMSSTGNMKVNFDDTIAPVIESVRAEQAADGYGITFAVTAIDNETQAADIVSRVQYAFAAEDVQNAPLNGLNLMLAPEDAGRTLYYRVSAADEAGNTVWSDIQSLVIADRTAPDAPADLVGTVNGSGVTLNWTASTDNVGVAGYQIRCGVAEILGGDGVLVADNRYALTGLKEGVYYWQTAAVDAAGNVSEWSEVKSFRILPEDAFGPVNTAERACDLGTLSGEQTLTGGAISSADDADWFKFTLNAKGTANDYVQIAFDNKLGDLDLYLYSSNGTTLLLTADGTTGDTEKISLKDLQKGTYLLKAVGKNGAMNTFSISTKKVVGYDMDLYDANSRNDSMEAATVFDLEKSPQATVSGLNLHEAGDVDYYQFTLANMGLSGDGVSISFENSVGDLDLVLFDSKGVKIAESAGTTNLETISFNGLAAGSYYVQVVAAHNAVNEYTLNWTFATNKVEPDVLEGQEPYAILESIELANLSISATGDGVTQEDTFTLTLNQPGSATSKIRFSNYRSDWNGLKYVVKNSDNEIMLSGIGSEISLDGLAAGDYSLTVDTPIAGSFSAYDISVSLPESAGTKWTYMVYMAADSNLDTYALYDLIAMQQANLDSQIDIYVLVDRSATSAYELSAISKNKWDSAWSDTRVGKITYNPGSRVSVDWESWGELDTSSIATLKQFVDWAQSQSVSENYGLIMWDHGTEDGSLCVDGTTDADWGTSLSISELSAFLSEKGNIPLVIFNNCLLGSEIVATQMTGSTDVIVVSEAESHPQNSTYAYKDFFSTITADMTAQEMAKALVQNVRQYGDGSQPSMLSAVDVTDSRLAKALEDLAKAVSASNNDNDRTVLINGLAKTLQDGCAYAGSTVYQSDLYDMIVQAMADRRYDGTSDGFKTALTSLKSVLEDVVLVSRSVPSNRGYGIATFNPVLTVKTYAASGYSAQKVGELIQSYLDANYAANPAWAGLLSDLAKTYQNQFGSSIRTASFSVSSIVDIGRDELISSMDLGCFSGQGEVIDGISLLGDLFLGVTITSAVTSIGAFSVANDMNAAVTISILAEDGKLVAMGTNTVCFSGLAVGDYYILLQSDDDCSVTLSFEADWMTGVDRFDYAQSKLNEKFANGNGSISKANALAAGYYSGLLTYQGDTDWYQIGNVYTERYKVVLEGGRGMTVAEYDAEGNLVQKARYSNGKYTMTVKSMNYLFVEGNADLAQDQVNSYSVMISGVQAGEEEPPVSEVAPQTQTWEKTEESTKYIVEYSMDNFEHVIQLVVDSNSLDSFQMPAGNYQTRVKPLGGGEWTVAAPVVAEETDNEAKLIRSNADGNADVFFVNSVGTWGSIYAAQHTGSMNDAWGGTKEVATLFGKNKLTDVIEGSTDANVLLMTDDANGDALFVDDIYSASPDELGLSQSRIAQIDEIRAGAGNDIVDMTSDKFEYTGDGLTIRGGDGNDTIWANKGDNFLFGDAGNDRIVGASGNDVIAGGIGNDRMHGGGGNDIFTFGENWGVDTVEQLAGGSVTLWFASGDESKWNAGTLTYTDGVNSVTVKGVTAEQITLKFGDDGSAQFATLSGMGAFMDVTSERIFEESGKGILASL